MNDFNGKCYFSGSDSSETLWRIFKNFCTVDYIGDPTPHANVGVSRFKRGVSAHAWSCRRQASIFTLSLMRIATGPPLDRSTPLTAQTRRPVGIHIPYMVWIIKINIFPIFYPKIWKIALWPTATSKSYNSGTFEDTCTLFAPNWGFSGSGDLMVSFKFTPDWPLLPWQPTTFI